MKVRIAQRNPLRYADIVTNQAMRKINASRNETKPRASILHVNFVIMLAMTLVNVIQNVNYVTKQGILQKLVLKTLR